MPLARSSGSNWPSRPLIVVGRISRAQSSTAPKGFAPELIEEDAAKVISALKEQVESNFDGSHPSWRKWLEQEKSFSVDALTDGIRGSVIESLLPEADKKVRATARMLSLVRHFQKMGHFSAKTDPLGLVRAPPFITGARYRSMKHLSTGDFTSFGLTEKDDFNRPMSICLPSTGGIVGTWNIPRADRHREWEGKFMSTLPDPSESHREWTCGEIFGRLQDVYCGTIGLEYLHIHDRSKINWLRNQMELPHPYKFSKTMKEKILYRTARAVLFEQFARTKFATMKRFGLDGCEALIVAVKSAANLSSLLGVDSIVLGMSHRGRLNILTNVMKKPAVQVFSEFMGHTGFGGAAWGNSGDVKYHMGVEYLYTDPNTNREMLMSVLPNPSHLEAVDPVILGTTKARQLLYGDSDGRKVLPILIHGDASIAGQGIVYETIQMSDLHGYSTGGTIHIVTNNQIGFTTTPAEAGSGNYCSDIAKTINAPIFHVNADDPEAVTRVMEIALQFRQKFNADVFIDIVGYRRFGHNELDLPTFTNPYMYSLIDNHPDVFNLYADRLIGEGVVSKDYVEGVKKHIWKIYDEAYQKAKDYRPRVGLRPFSVQWKDMATPDQICAPRLTGVTEEAVRRIGSEINRIPSNITVHPTIARIYKQREVAMSNGKGIDFGLAEALAFGTLLRDGNSVRIAGQDSERGTFSHRHAGIHDQKKGSVHEVYYPLRELISRNNYQGSFDIINSPLSEYACLGFEYGYSLEHPDNLVIWEAQFGDFANGAQIAIDQFIASGEVKWNHPSGLVLLLPHGFDGQGPEHSSARIERFLQLCDDREDVIHPLFWDVQKRSVIQRHNMQVVLPTTAGNLFHVIRRQINRGFRKPLVLLCNKKLLRLKDACSDLSEFIEGTRFQRYISDPMLNVNGPEASVERKKRVERLVLCSGQVYYDLVRARTKISEGTADKIAIGRIEQLSPCPLDQIADEISELPNLKSVVWCQEEPMNQGAWGYINTRVKAVLGHLGNPNGVKEIIYAGRDVSASVATGDHKLHEKEQATLIKDALDVQRTTNSHYEKYLHGYEATNAYSA